MAKVNSISFKGIFSSNGEAQGSLCAPGDGALVLRGVPRLFLLRCPCGCGDTLVMNLDQRSGPAWRLYQRASGITVFPSYWRDSHCCSHFIIWGDKVLWCDWEDFEDVPETANDLERRLVEIMPRTFISYQTLADQLDEIPWAVLQACRALVRKKEALPHPDWKRGEFRRF